VPSNVTNFDIRAEWFFSSGANFTVTLFSKEIEQPIEFFESPASDTTVAREILNAESAEVSGIELEYLEGSQLPRRAFRHAVPAGQPDAAGFRARRQARARARRRARCAR
jgi:hypothetical protein